MTIMSRQDHKKIYASIYSGVWTCIELLTLYIIFLQILSLTKDLHLIFL